MMTEGTILIIDDDENNLLLICRSLSNAHVGNSIKIAQDGVEALNVLLEGPSPLPPLPISVLLDVNMPRIDGLEVLQRIRIEERTRELPVVILTSSDQQEDLLRGYRLGVNNYVRKPIDFEVFQEMVGRVGLYWTLGNRVPRVN